jgi:hypothetical protein
VFFLLVLGSVRAAQPESDRVGFHIKGLIPHVVHSKTSIEGNTENADLADPREFKGLKIKVASKLINITVRFCLEAGSVEEPGTGSG